MANDPTVIAKMRKFVDVAKAAVVNGETRALFEENRLRSEG